MKEYKFSKTFRILTFIFSPILIAGFVYIGFLPFIKGYSLTAKIFLIVFSIFLITAVIISLIEVVKIKLVIKDKTFIQIRIFSIRILRFNEIKGFRIVDNNIFLIPSNNSKRISVTKYFTDISDLVSFLNSNFKNLDRADRINRKKKFFNNKEYGKNKKEIKAKVKKIKKKTRLLNYIGTVLALILIFYPKYYELLIILNIAMSIFAFGVIIKSKGFVHFIEDKDSQNPMLDIALLMPVSALLYRTSMDYDIYNYQNVWLPIVFLTGGIMYLLIKYSKEELKIGNIAEKFIIYPLFSIYVGIFMFAFIIQINCTFDKSEYEKSETTVVSKSIYEVRYTTYEINIVDWNDKEKNIDVTIGRNMYSKLKVNDKVEILLRPGLLNIPWYQVRIK